MKCQNLKIFYFIFKTLYETDLSKICQIYLIFISRKVISKMSYIIVKQYLNLRFYFIFLLWNQKCRKLCSSTK